MRLSRRNIRERNIIEVLILASRKRLKGFLSEEKYIDRILGKYPLRKMTRYEIVGEVCKW